MERYGKRLAFCAAGVLLIGILAGCGSGNTKTEEGMKLLESLDYAGALAQFTQARELGEDLRMAARGQGIACMGLVDYEQAIVCFQEALAAGSGFVQSVDYDINYYLAAAYSKSGRYAEAEQTYDAILALRSGEKDACFLRGAVRLAQSDYEGAKADFDRVLSLEPGNYDRLIEVYQVLEHYGYAELGREYLQRVLDNTDKQITAFDQGRIFYYMGSYQEAASALEQARDAGAQSCLYLGKAYEAMGDYNYAANVYNSYLAQNEPDAEILNQLGLCELNREEYQKALEAFQTGMKIENNGIMQTLSFNEIVAYEYLGEYQKASVLLNSYLNSYPDDEAAVREQDFLSTR